jgi:hypothetical protein
VQKKEMPVSEQCPSFVERHEQFVAFHEANPEVWELFERFCLEMIEAGKSDFGAPVVWERIRWEVSLETRGNEPYRLPNIHRPLYARMFQERHPELAHHIATRPLRPERPDQGVEEPGAALV